MALLQGRLANARRTFTVSASVKLLISLARALVLTRAKFSLIDPTTKD